MRCDVRHFSEADLLETWYTPAGSSLAVMMHVADCGECAARYARLESKFDALFTCPHAGAHRRARFALLSGLVVAALVLVTLGWRFMAMA